MNGVVLEDFSDIVTKVDLGFDDFSGNSGALNKDGQPYGQSNLVCTNGNACALLFKWDFRITADPEAFTGLFFSLFGLTSTQATFDGQTVTDVSFSEHSLDFDQIDGLVAEPGGARSLRKVKFALLYTDEQPLTLRVELKDVNGGGRFWRLPITGSTKPQTLTWNYRKHKRIAC